MKKLLTTSILLSLSTFTYAYTNSPAQVGNPTPTMQQDTRIPQDQNIYNQPRPMGPSPQGKVITPDGSSMQQQSNGSMNNPQNMPQGQGGMPSGGMPPQGQGSMPSDGMPPQGQGSMPSGGMPPQGQGNEGQNGMPQGQQNMNNMQPQGNPFQTEEQNVE